MTKLDIAISSIKYSLEVSEEELDIFIKIAKSLNEKTNKLMMKTGKISDRLLLFIILLINLNKKEKIFNNFEENIAKLLKKASPLLQNKDSLDSQLILAGIITENETQDIIENISQESKITDENLSKIIEENNRINEETLKFIDDVIKIIEKLANNINEL